jgi:hypothetical protein
LTSGYCFTIATKGELDSITKGELIKDTLKISTKGEFFYIRTGTNYKAGTTGGIDSDSLTSGYCFTISYKGGTGLNYKGGTGQRYPQNFYKGGIFLHTYWYKLQRGNYWRYS